MTSSKPNYLPKAQPPNITLELRLGFQYMNLSGEEHKLSVHSRDLSYQSLREEEPTQRKQTTNKKRQSPSYTPDFSMVWSSTSELACLILYSEKLIPLAPSFFMSLKIKYFREK